MGKYSLQYRAAMRRALKSPPLTQKPIIQTQTQAQAQARVGGDWQSARYIGFNPTSGQHVVRLLSGETKGATRIPGYGAEFGGMGIGGIGLLSQGFWSH